MRSHVLATAAMATMLTAFAQPAAAQQYRSYHDEHVANQYECERSRNNRTAGGAVIGGIVGALLGREIAGNRGVRDEGTGLGAVVGAVAGGAIGRSSARCDSAPEGDYDPYYGRPYSQGDGYYRGDDDDLYGGPYGESGYYGGDEYRDCRMREQVLRDRYGRRYREDVYMCRGSDGVWRRER
ncbi:MAG: glycine zipper 2TM domain-containing protein [Caulobacteraceae bacterium]